MAKATRKLSVTDWTQMAEKRLAATLKAARAEPGLRRRLRTERPWSAHVQLLGSAAMARLNKKYRGKNYATDVLSFESPEPFRVQGLLGDLVICLPVLKRQALEHGHTPEKELQVLVVHGVLHLLGLDHEESEKAAREMHRWEDKLLKKKAKGLIRRTS